MDRVGEKGDSCEAISIRSIGSNRDMLHIQNEMATKKLLKRGVSGKGSGSQFR